MDNETIIQLGDLVTLKGMKKVEEKPIGMVKKKWATNDIEIIWLNTNIAKRFAVHNIVSKNKLEVVSKVSQESS